MLILSLVNKQFTAHSLAMHLFLVQNTLTIVSKLLINHDGKNINGIVYYPNSTHQSQSTVHTFTRWFTQIVAEGTDGNVGVGRFHAGSWWLMVTEKVPHTFRERSKQRLTQLRCTKARESFPLYRNNGFQQYCFIDNETHLVKYSPKRFEYMANIYSIYFKVSACVM